MTKPLAYMSDSRIELEPDTGPVPVAAQPIVVDRYTLHTELAVGGMATVYLGRIQGSVGFSRTVAVKRLHKQYARDPKFVAMFYDEARLCARIRHPNVVPTLDVVATDGELFLIMEYVHGEVLSRLQSLHFRAQDRMPIRIAAAIMVGTLQGLHAAHEAVDEFGKPLGMVHRDVSPQNILLGVDGVPRVLDFGVAKAAGRLQNTREGEIKGKVAYMAPEQIKGDPKISRSADVYAASVVFWELLAGRRLFQADNEVALMNFVLEANIPSLEALVPDLPPGLDEVVQKGLSRNVLGRFITAQQMAQAIERCVGIASNSEVSAWLDRLAGVKLRAREQKIAKIEREMAKTMSSTQVIREVKTSSAGPGEARSGVVESQVRRGKEFAWVVGGAVAFALVLGVVIALLVHRSGDAPLEPEEIGEPSANPSESAIAEKPVEKPIPTSTTVIPTVTSLPAAADSVMKPSDLAKPHPSTKVIKPKAPCDPPFVIDSAGRKVYREDCP